MRDFTDYCEDQASARFLLRVKIGNALIEQKKLLLGSQTDICDFTSARPSAELLTEKRRDWARIPGFSV